MLGWRKTIKKCNGLRGTILLLHTPFFCGFSLESQPSAGNWPWGCRVWGAAWPPWPRGAQPGAQQPQLSLQLAFHEVRTSAHGLCEHCCVLWQRRHKHSAGSISRALLPAWFHLCIKNGYEEIELSESGLNFWSYTSFFSVSLLMSHTERCWNHWEGPGGNNSVQMPFAQNMRGKTPPVLAFLETCK